MLLAQAIYFLMIETKYECIVCRMYYAPENYSQSDEVSIHAGGLKIMSIKAKYNHEPNGNCHV